MPTNEVRARGMVTATQSLAVSTLGPSTLGGQAHRHLGLYSVGVVMSDAKEGGLVGEIIREIAVGT